jgi:hypothetical protein
MLIAFIESRPKAGVKREVWEDIVLARLEMATAPQLGWVIRIPGDGGAFRRYRVREVVQDLPGCCTYERVTEQELQVYVVPIPPSGTLEAALPGVGLPRQLGMFDGTGVASGAG